MNKTTLQAYVDMKAKLDPQQARLAMDAVFEGIVKALRYREHVTLIDFGSFSISKRAKRNGHNPQLGVPMKVPATQVVKFTPSAKLKAIAKSARSPKNG